MGLAWSGRGGDSDSEGTGVEGESQTIEGTGCLGEGRASAWVSSAESRRGRHAQLLEKASERRGKTNTPQGRGLLLLRKR